MRIQMSDVAVNHVTLTTKMIACSPGRIVDFLHSTPALEIEVALPLQIYAR
jgi:hypothetical protein